MGRRKVDKTLLNKTYSITVQRDGDDLVLVFPVEVLDIMGAKSGDEVVWELQPDGTVTIRPTFGDTAIEANISDAIDDLET